MDTLITPAINATNARELQRKGVEARKRNQELRRLAAIGASVSEVKPVIAPVNPLEDKFARALEKTLDDFLTSTDATERAKNARSMREVRETYHLWSGAPKPGTIKPERTSSRARMSPRPPEPEPIDPSTPQ